MESKESGVKMSRGHKADDIWPNKGLRISIVAFRKTAQISNKAMPTYTSRFNRIKEPDKIVIGKLNKK